MRNLLPALSLMLALVAMPSPAARAETPRSRAEALTKRAFEALSKKTYDASADLFEQAAAAWQRVRDADPTDVEAKDNQSTCRTNFIYSLSRPNYEAIGAADAHMKKQEFEAAARLFLAAKQGYQRANRRLRNDEEFAQNLKYATRRFGEAQFSHAAATGGSAPDFNLESMRSGRVRLSAYRGKAVLVVVWASWCGHCRREIPALDEFYRAHRNEGLVVIGVNADRVEGWDRGGADAATELVGKVAYPVAWATQQTIWDYGSPSGIPVMMWINPEGRLVNPKAEWDRQALEREFARIKPAAGRNTPPPSNSAKQPGRTAPPRRPDDHAAPANTIYTNREVGFSLTLPADGWTKRGQSAKYKNVLFTIVRTAPLQGEAAAARFRPNVCVGIESLRRDYTADEYAEFAVAALKRSDWNVSSQQPSRWGNARGTDVRASRDDLVLHQRYVVVGRRVVVIAAIAHKQQVSAVDREFQAILDSYRATGN